MSEVNKINLKSVHGVMENTSGSPLDGCLHSEDSTDSVSALKHDGIEEDCPEKVKEMNGIEFENHNRSELAKDPSDATGKILQCDAKLQTSEIKERVMGFLTKYAKVDEATGCIPNTVPSSLKKECVKEREINDLNADNNASDVSEREPIEGLSAKKNLDCNISCAKSAVTSSLTPKILFAAETKDLASSHNSQSWSCESPTQNYLAIANQEKLNNKQFITLKSDSSLQTDIFLSFMSDVKPVRSTESTSANDFGSCNPDTENSCLKNTLESGLHGVQQDNGTLFNTFELEPLSILLKTSPSFLNHSDCVSQNEITKENKLKANDILSNNLPCDVGSEMKCASKAALDLFSFSVPSLNDNVHLLSRGNAGVAVNSLISPWEKMSFQPQTTPSISSPILSCKSSNNNYTSKYTGYSEYRPVIFQSENVNSGMRVCSSSLDSTARAENSDTIYNNGDIFKEEIRFLNNANDQNFVKSCFKLPEKSASPKCIDGENVSDITVNNSDGNAQNIFSGSQVEYFSGATEGNPTCESVNNGIPFKTCDNNPFMKKTPVQSIGLFKSPLRTTTVCGVGDFVVKSVSSSTSVVSSIEKKVENSMENSTKVGKSNLLNENIIEEPSQFVLQAFENKSNQKYDSSVFSRNVCNEKQSVDTEEPNQVQEVIGSTNNLHSELFKSGFAFKRGINVTSSQLALSSGKPKSFTATQFHNHRITWKLVKPVGQNGKGFSYPEIDKKENSNTCNITEKGTCVRFAPVCGLDPHELNKKVKVRYQNITLMKEYINVSTEEMRSQFYTECKSWPFKFCASHEPNYRKKTKSQETQTDEDLVCKKPDLGGIWRVLECPVCLDVVLPPVYQCEQGHHVCSSCWKKIITCPLCKRHKSIARNYMAEALVEQIPLPCRYHIEGCKESVQPTNKVSHEEICIFRTYLCPVPFCKHAHSYQNMCKHFKNTHKSLLHHQSHSVAKGEKFYEVLYKETLSDPLVRAFDIANWGLFFLREVTVKHSEALFMQIMPAVSDQAVYFYHLEVSDHHDCRQECYKGRVHPIGKPSQEIINQEEYLSLSELIMKTVKKGSPLKVVVRIWQLKSAFTFSKD